MTSHRPDDDGHPHGLQYDLANLARQAHLRKLDRKSTRLNSSHSS